MGPRLIRPGIWFWPGQRAPLLECPPKPQEAFGEIKEREIEAREIKAREIKARAARPSVENPRRE
jgi:hypothetical protein